MIIHVVGSGSKCLSKSRAGARWKAAVISCIGVSQAFMRQSVLPRGKPQRYPTRTGGGGSCVLQHWFTDNYPVFGVYVEDIQPDVICRETALPPLSDTVPGTKCCSKALRPIGIRQRGRCGLQRGGDGRNKARRALYCRTCDSSALLERCDGKVSAVPRWRLILGHDGLTGVGANDRGLDRPCEDTEARFCC